MTRPGIEPRSPGSLANTQPTGPICHKITKPNERKKLRKKNIEKGKKILRTNKGRREKKNLVVMIRFEKRKEGRKKNERNNHERIKKKEKKQNQSEILKTKV